MTITKTDQDVLKSYDKHMGIVKGFLGAQLRLTQEGERPKLVALFSGPVENVDTACGNYEVIVRDIGTPIPGLHS